MDGGGHGGGFGGGHGGGFGGGPGGHFGGHGGGDFGGHGPGGNHGGGGPDPSQPAGVRLTRCDDRAIVAVRGWGASRLFVLPFVASGLFIAAMGLWLVAQPEHAAGSLFLIVFGLVFATACFPMLQPWRLEIDVASRTYEERLGWGRLCKVTRGGWGDFARLVTRTYREGAGGTDLLLYWEDASRSPVALFTGTDWEAARLWRDLAQRLGLPPPGAGARSATEEWLSSSW